MPRKPTSATRAALALLIAFPLAGCWDHDLVASWYLVHDRSDEGPSADASSGDDPAAPASSPAPTSTPAAPKLYVALLNRDRKTAEVYDVSLDAPDAADRRELPIGPRNSQNMVTMPPGRLLIMSAGETGSVSPANTCTTPVVLLPIRLYVRLGPKKKTQEVMVERPMPSTLPYEWQPECPGVVARQP